MIIKTPRKMPIWDIAKGIASTPAPTIVLTRLITLLGHDACPAYPVSFRLCLLLDEAVLLGREPCSLAVWVIAE